MKDMRKYQFVLITGMIFLLSTITVSSQNFICLSDMMKPAGKQIDTIGRGTFNRNALWENGSTVRVRILNGTQKFRDTVIKYASEWTKYANLKFNFVEEGVAEIRVKFVSGGSWSLMGTDALSIKDQDSHTLQIYCDTTWDDDYYMKRLRRVIRHEFGHAIGLEHEHLSPVSGIRWNKPAVFKYYMNSQGWDSATVENALLKKLDAESTNGEFDKSSIMIYSIPNSLMNLPDTAMEFIKSTTELSSGDQKTIAHLYPVEIPKKEKEPVCEGLCSAISIISENYMLKVYPSFKINNAEGQDMEIFVFYYDDDENPIINRMGEHIGESGQLIGYRQRIPPWENTLYNNALLSTSVSTPLSDFKLREGEKMSIAYRVVVRLNGKEVGRTKLFYRDIEYVSD